MGRTRNLSTDHIITKKYISEYSICSNCPIKLYKQKEDKVIYGIGNICSNTIFVLDPYDVRKNIKYETLLQKLCEEYNKITSTNLLDDYYVTRIIKCLDKSNYEMYNEASKSCINHFITELNFIKPLKLIFFGDSFDYAYNNLFSKLNISCDIYTVYSPAIFFYDNIDLHNKFVEQLTKAIYD